MGVLDEFLSNINKDIAQSKARAPLMDAALKAYMGRSGRAVGGSTGGGGAGGYSPAPAGKRGSLVTITAPNGQKVTVDSGYAGKFSGLLNDLWRSGYKFKSVGGYNYRNIAGTNTLSKHALGQAIDIDPGPNRGDRLSGGGSKYGYFNPATVGAIVKKYGLDWGAWWKSADPMHFSSGG
jgi:D-alanyl-D-alanine carboxypeptidase